MKTNKTKTLLLLMGVALLATACTKEELRTNSNSNSLTADYTLVGDWAYQCGEEEYIHYPSLFDTTLVPEYPTVRDLRFAANGTAVVEERSLAEVWPPMYVETSYTWSISANHSHIQMIGARGEIYNWQILLLTSNQLKVKITHPAAGNGSQLISTNTYVRR